MPRPSLVEMDVRGSAQLVRALEKLPRRVQTRVARKALRPAGAMVSKAAKKAVPEITTTDLAGLVGHGNAGDTTGAEARRFLKKSIKRKTKTYRDTATAIEAVGIRYDERLEGLNVTAGKLGEMIEFGDDDRPADPWMRGVADDVADRALSSMVDRAEQLVHEEARKAKGAGGG